MRYRSASRRAGLLLVTLITGLAIAAPARAQETHVDMPPNAPVVAGPTASGAKLVAFLHHGQLCTAIVEKEPADPVVPGGDGACDAVPTLTPYGHDELDASGPDFDTDRLLTPVLVGTDTAAVELRQAGQTVARSKTVPSPLPGTAADLRFALLETDNPPAADELALLDDSGTVRRAYDQSGPSGLIGIPVASDSPVGAIVQRGRLGGVPWTLRAGTVSVLAPTPFQPERRVPRGCMLLSSANQDDGSFAEDTLASGTCEQQEDAQRPIVTSVSSGCPPAGTQLAVLARPTVRRVIVVLGDGSRHAIPLTAVPVAAEMRAGGIVLPADAAVRHMVALDRSGSVLLKVRLGLEPVSSHEDCTESGPGFTTYSLVRSGLVLSHAGPHTPVVVDRGTDICVGVDRGLRGPTNCGPAPIEPDDAQLLSRQAPDGRYLFGIFPADVAGARLEFDDGGVVEVPATPIPGYLGQYAGVLRMIAVSMVGAHRVIEYHVLDARGRMLVDDLSSFSGPERPALRQLTTLQHVPGLPAVHVAWRPGNAEEPPDACLALGAMRDENDCDHLGADTAFTVHVECAPQRILVYGGLRRTTDRLVVRTASGREIVARILVLPPSIRGIGGVAAVALVALGPEDPPRRLIRRGRVPLQGPFVLPAAGRQCGYDTGASLRPEPGLS